jgi:lipoprotein-anchoring transpeptidase ErfK/SrfK
MAAAPPPVAAQEIVAVTRAQTARVRPTASARAIERVPATRPITGARTTLPVVGHTTRDGARWLHVALPGRPNGHQGWIRARNTRTTSTPWRVDVDLSKRRVDIRYDGRLRRHFTVVVGKSSTPTPTGRFFVEETVQMPAGAVGAPYALALSARSTVLQEFEGGPGQIALHGLDNVGGTPGTAESHGCIRLRNGDIAWIAQRIGPGVPVTIRR